MRNLVTEYATGQLIAGAIILVLALLWDNYDQQKRRHGRGPWKDQ